MYHLKSVAFMRGRTTEEEPLECKNKPKERKRAIHADLDSKVLTQHISVCLTSLWGAYDFKQSPNDHDTYPQGDHH